MRYVRHVEIAAPPDRVWSVLADLERWPSWTPTVTALEVAVGSGMQVGTRVRIMQPGMRPTTYTVTEVDDGRRFTWEARRAGLRQHAEHAVEPAGDGGTTVTLTFALDGPLGRLASPLAGTTVRRMVDTEAEALRDRLEHPPPG